MSTQRILAYILLYTLVFSLAGLGCSHKSPFVRPGVEQCIEPCATDDEVKSRVLLIGDAGAPAQGKTEPVEGISDPTLVSLYYSAAKIPERTTVIFLGDNIYPKGLPDEAAGRKYEEAKGRLEAQLLVVRKSKARGIFVPGNHDWEKSGKDGYAAILRQEKFVNGALAPDTSFLPIGGCPGPFKLDLDGVRLIFLDTQWWLHQHDKPITSCLEDEQFFNGATGVDSIRIVKNAVIGQLKDFLATAGEREVVVMAHHPLATHGPHGGFFDWKDYFFPLTNISLPIIKNNLWIPSPVLLGGITYLLGFGPEVWIPSAAVAPFIYPKGRWYLLRHDQDLNGPRNKEVVGELKRALSSGKKPVVFASGHDHSLQVLDRNVAADYLLVSGLGSSFHGSTVTDGNDTVFAHLRHGFMQVDFLKNGRVLLRIIEPNGQRKQGEIVFSKWLR
jgi:hypothetical protein